MVNQAAHTNVSPTHDTTPHMCPEKVQFGLAASTKLGRHIVCSAVDIGGPQPVLVTKYTLFGIVAMVINRLTASSHLHTILQPRMCHEEVQYGLATSITLGHHIVCSAVHIGGPQSVLVIKYTLFGIVAMVNQAAHTIVLPTQDTTPRMCPEKVPAPHWAVISCVALSTSAGLNRC
jgi:high-affinity Fe2+/Pb2+ permease